MIEAAYEYAREMHEGQLRKNGEPYVYHQLTGTGPFEGGSVRVDPTGEVTINSGAAPQGQGTATMLAQIAADELQVPHDTIKVVFGDTGRLAHGMGTYASRNAVMAGTAVVMASTKVREKALALAAHLVEADPSDMVLEDGYAHVKGVPTTRVQLGRDRGRGEPRRQPAGGDGAGPGVGAVLREHGRPVLLRDPHRRGGGRPGHRASRRSAGTSSSTTPGPSSTPATPRDRSPAGWPRDSAAR